MALIDCSTIPTDLTVKAGNKGFEVHRFMLASRSPYFNKLLTGGFKERDMTVITLSDIDTDTFTEYLNVIYCRSYVSSPSLMMLVNMYEVRGITIDTLHKSFNVPFEQFEEYIEIIKSLYPSPLPRKTIDTIASKITSSEYNEYIPLDIRDRIYGSKNFHFYGNEWDTCVKELLVEATLEKAANIKGIYSINHCGSVMAYGLSDGLLKLRGKYRVRQYIMYKEFRAMYDEGIETIQGDTHLPKLSPGTRYIKINPTTYNAVTNYRPTIQSINTHDFFTMVTYEKVVSSTDLKNYITADTEERKIGLGASNFFDIKYEVPAQNPIMIGDTISVQESPLPGVYKSINWRYAIVLDNNGYTLCIGEFGGSSGVLHILSDTYPTERYGLRIIGPCGRIADPYFLKISDTLVVDMKNMMAYEHNNMTISKFLGLYDVISKMIFPAPIEVRYASEKYIDSVVDL